MAIVDFFLGSMTSEGFFSLFEDAAKPPVESYLLKGTPGSGKSTMMKKICSAFSDNNMVEQIHCAASPDSLDGVIYPEKQIAIFDATSPHALDPAYPVAAETEVSLYDCINPRRIAPYKEQVIEYLDNKSLASVRCKNFLHAMKTLLDDNSTLVLEHTDLDKIQRLARKLCLKELPRQNRKAKEYKRLLSGITPNGVLTYENTVHELCSRVYIIKDEYTCASVILLSILRLYALETGQEFYTCFYPLESSGKIEHLIFPELEVAFVTSHRNNDFSFQPYRSINFTRFTDITALKKHKQRLRFHRKAADELLKEAVYLLQLQHGYHDFLEDIYTNATDFSCVNIITAKLVNHLAGRL